MLPKQDVFQYVHRGLDNPLTIKVADVWNPNSSQISSDNGFQRARKVTLEKFDLLPTPNLFQEVVIIIHIPGCRGKFLKNGTQTDIWAIMTPDIGSNYSYKPFIVDWVDIGPYDTEISIRFSDKDDKDIVFEDAYTVAFSITSGYE